MADNINLDELSDEDFLNALNSENAEYESPEAGQEEVTEKLEDTNQDDDSGSDTAGEDETNDDGDGQNQDTSEPEVDDTLDDQEENSQGEDSGEADDSSDEDDDGDDSDSDSEDDTQTKSGNDGESKDSDEIDYKAEYARLSEANAKLQSFYDGATSEFTANGRKVRGFTDPKKIIQSQQMSASYSDRMAALKPYRPLMKPLKERGYLDDPEAFDFAMQVMDGDVESVKKLLKDKGIDPFEMDMENINHEKKAYASTEMDVAIDEMFESAGRAGIQNELQTALSKDWDDESLVSILKDNNYKNDLLEHMSNGTYDIVQDRIAEIKRSDNTGRYSDLSKIDQYKQAIVSLNKEHTPPPGSEKDDQSAKPDVDDSAQKEEEYKKKLVAQKNKKASEARKKASSVSRKKSGTKKDKQSFDPDKLSDEEFESMIQGMIMN
ncbi:MAG: hypothetical protein U9N61_07360 [Euryarchaeota archaeon]|nr:hypothetical protein [Euryarchaeota archaeon]